MVKLGFIVEGDTEKIILESKEFRNFLTQINIDFIPEVINAKGNGNLLPQNIDKFSKILFSKGATKIFILTDLDDDNCITKTKERIQPSLGSAFVVSVKQIEAWFLNDTEAMRSFFSDPSFSDSNPELHEIPFEKIKSFRIEKQNRGIGSKKILASLMCNQNNFSIQKAAQHKNSSSVNYFIGKLKNSNK